MPLSLLQPSFLMSKTRSYAQILIGSRLLLTTMAIYLSLRVPPLINKMSILVYIAMAINNFSFQLTKHPLSLRSIGIGIEIGAFSMLFTLVAVGFRGSPSGSISQSGTSIHVPMPILILSNYANSPISTFILFFLETHLLIPSFLESPLKEEIEAQEGIPKPSSLTKSFCIHVELLVPQPNKRENS
ncbi:hypothetical protein CDL12_01026 [Handroanthus impetiginosus]|uniref:Uncharacterized protein n=1 Tax=Handroanthus impetiginosus TaxID=429701 RepID=A0A2G9I8Z7_9LAMI|nr:hypothetical protein CDL12_01026 [Handroanthus impetiginosus]